MRTLRNLALLLMPLAVVGAPIVDVTLIDGSEVAGEFSKPELNVMASFGELELAVESIARIQRRGDHEIVHFQNGDRLTVTLSGESLGLTTKFGPVTLPISKIAKLRMRDARALPLHLAPALVLHLPLDEEIPRDHGPLATVLAPVATEFRHEGKHRGAHYFDGSLSAFTMRSDKLDIAGSLSISVWARMDGATANSYQRLYQRGYGGTRIVEMWVEDAGTLHGNVAFRINASAAPSVRVDYSIPKFEYGRWYHYAAVFDDEADELRLFVNGEQVGETPFAGAIRTGYPINLIGNWRARGERSWYGLIDDFLLFNQALSAADIRTLYQR
jgi:hypothetical protein